MPLEQLQRHTLDSTMFRGSIGVGAHIRVMPIFVKLG